MSNLKKIECESFTNIMIINFDVFESIMKHMIDKHVDGLEIPARALYSSSVDDRKTVCYLLVEQDIKLELRREQNSVVDHLVRCQPAQSLNKVRERSKFISISIPILEVPQRYRRIRFNIPKSDNIGGAFAG